MVGIISDSTSLAVTNLLLKSLTVYPSALQNEICDRVYDYIYYRLGRVTVENVRANALLACVYDLHDEFMYRCANRSLASGTFLPTSLADAMNRRRHCTVTLIDDYELINKMSNKMIKEL